MRFVVSEISFRRSLYGSVFIELTLTPVKHEIDSKIYASCDIGVVEGELLRPEVVERGHLKTLYVRKINTGVEHQRCTNGLTLVDICLREL